MTLVHHRPRHLGWGATTLALAATIINLSTPAATATLQSEGVEVQDCSTGTCSVPSSYVVGHTYWISAGSPVASGVTAVSFYDNGTCLGGYSIPHTGPAGINWVPTTDGTHKITVQAATSIPFLIDKPTVVPVAVIAAPPGSPTPQPAPQQGSCVGSGSAMFDHLGSGSANLLYPGYAGN